MEKRGRLNELAKHCVRAVSGTTLAEIAGDRRVLIEHHCGVIAYDPEKICIKTTYGRMAVTGCNLHLSQMTESILVISGKIMSVVTQGG